MKYIFWLFVLWQAWRIVKKVLGFSHKDWDEVLAPTMMVFSLLLFVAVLGFALALFAGFLFTFV